MRVMEIGTCVPPSDTVILTGVPTPPPAPRLLIVTVKFPLPLVGNATASDGFDEFNTLLALPPEILTTPLPPSGMQSDWGATANGKIGSTVPTSVLMSMLTNAPVASVTIKFPGFKQKFGSIMLTVNASPLRATVVLLNRIWLGKVVLPTYGGNPPKTKIFTVPTPQLFFVAPVRVTDEGIVESGVDAPLVFVIMNVKSRYAPVATSARRNCAY